MSARSPLVGPALGLVAGVTIGLQGYPFPAAALAALPLALSLRFAPAAFAVAGWLLAAAGGVAPGTPSDGAVTLEGRVVSVPDRWGDRLGLRLRTSRGVLLEAFGSPAEWPIALGDRVRATAELRVAPGARNPGGRDAARRLSASGIALRAHATGPLVRVAVPSPAARLEDVRERFAAAATAALPAREAALVRAIGLGDRAALDPATTASFARSGLAHVLAVSGFHLVVVAFGLERLLRFLLLRLDFVALRADPRRLSSAAVLPVALAYALATGGGVPVLRAVLAAVVAFAGALIDREASTENVLALAALVLLAADPGAALDPSLQLSFAAVAGLARWAGPLRRALPIAAPPCGSWRARLAEPLLVGACATLAATAATAPVLAFHFRQLPLLGVVANVLAVPVGATLTVLSALAAAAAAASPAVAWPLLVACHPPAWALMALSDAAAAPRVGVLGLASPGLVGATLAAAAALLAACVRGRWRAGACAAAVLSLALPGPLRATAARVRGGLEVIFISVGQGDAALLRLPDGAAVLVDAGGSPEGGPDPGARDVVPLLRDLGVRELAAVFVSHPHPDHVLGLAAVAQAFPIGRVYSNGDAGEGASREILAALRPEPLPPGARWERAGVAFEVLGGDRTPLPSNDASLVLRVVHGETSFLFTGDVEARGEAAAVAAGGLGADVVKVPHHGSRTSSSAPFVAAVRPRFAVVSLATGNRYGFPHDEALARWRGAGARILRTDEGAVRFLSDGRAVRVTPARTALDPLAILAERP